MARFAILPKRGTVDNFKKYGKLTEEKDFIDSEILAIYDKKVFLLSSPDKDIDQLLDEWYSPKTNEVIEISDYYYNKTNLSNRIRVSSTVSFVALVSFAFNIMNNAIVPAIFTGVFLILFGISLIKNNKDMKELKKPDILVDWESRHGNNKDDKQKGE